MALTGRPETRDRGDGPPVLHDGEGQAGHDALSIGQHGAGAALAEAAALLGARQVQHIPQDIQQRRSRVDGKRSRGSVDLDLDIDGSGAIGHRSEEHTSELQSLMRISYAVFCLKKKRITCNKSKISSKQTKRT